MDSARRPSMLATMPSDPSMRGVPSPFRNQGPSQSPGQYNSHMTPHFQPASPVPGGHLMHQTPVPVPNHPQHAMQSQAGVRPMQYQQQYQQQQQHQLPPQPQQPAHAQNYAPGYPQSPAPPMHHLHQAMNPLAAGYNQMPVPAAGRTSMAPQPNGMPHANMYNPPRPPEVYTLPDVINEALPEEMRRGFQHDPAGRVLFFTAPPLDRAHKGISPESAGLGHSVQFLAGRKEWLAEREKKRKDRDEARGLNADKRMALDTSSARDTVGTVTSQAADAMDKWFDHFNHDTQRWTRDAGLDGWRQAVGGNV